MVNYQTLSENELISQLINGDKHAYAEIYERYFQPLFVFAYKKIRDEEIAKDMVQELFIRVWERRENLAENKNLPAYLFVAIRNKVFDHFNHHAVENKYIQFLENYVPSNRLGEADYKIREKQLAEYIERQIQALPKKMRRMFEMSRKEHLSHREIATALETSENNVSTQIMNAIRILKAKLSTLLVIALSYSIY